MESILNVKGEGGKMFCSIGKFSELTGLGVHTLRYYEREWLLSPARSQANRRVYTERDAAWASFYRSLVKNSSARW